MAQKTPYEIHVEPQNVDFTLHATAASLGSAILNVAGTDAQTKGFGVDVLGQNNVSWVLSRLAMEFDCRPRQYTAYTLHTWVNDFNRVMSTRNFTLTDSAGNCFGRAVSQWCLLDLSTRTAVDMTSTARTYSHWIVDEPSPADRPRRIHPITQPAAQSTHRVAYSDIDFNRHMNTLRYVELMVDMLPVELAASQRPVRFDINFLHEAVIGQTLTVACDHDGDTWRFGITADNMTECLRAEICFG